MPNTRQPETPDWRFGASGPAVLSGGLWVDGATASLLYDALRLVFRDVRSRDGAPPHPHLVELARAAGAVARQWAATSAEDVRNSGMPEIEPADNVAIVRTAKVAELLGISTRAVRGLAERQTLPGAKDGKGWRFALVDVVAATETREERYA